MKLLVLLLLVVAVTANAAVLGSRKCSYGPSYWCGSINQAKECGALQYCSDNDWADIKTKDGEFCTDCEIGIGILQEQLEKANTEEEIIKVMEKFCTDLGALAQDCKLIVDAYGAEVIKALVQELKPEQVCALMGFCKSETFVRDPKKDESSEIMTQLMNRASTKLMEIMATQMFAGDKMCTDCTNFINDIKKLLNNATVEAEITSEIKLLCKYLGSYKTECELIVTTLIPQGIGQLVEKINAKQDCTAIGFCKSELTDEPIPEPPPPNDPCSDCKAFMGDVKTLLSNATVQNMIIKDLDSFCNDLGSLAPQCQEYVDQYGPLVFSLLLQYFDPNMVCSTIGFCKSEELMMSSADACSECQTYIQDVANILSSPAVQKTMLDEITSVCKLLKITDNCEEYVSEYGPMLLNLFLQYLDPASLCNDIGFCTSEPIPEALPEPGDFCTDCQSFVKDFDNLLNNYTIQEKLLKDIAVLCKYFPNYSADCKMYVEQYGALVFEVIAGLINPKTVCTDIGLCPGVKSPRPTLPKLPVAILNTMAPNDVCGNCKNLLQDIQSILSDPSIQKMIITEIEQLCNDLGPFGPQCKVYVDEYAPMIFTYLLQYIDPVGICTDIGLCSADFDQSPVNVNADVCADCKAFLGDVTTILNTPSVQQMILQEIETLCNDLGPSLGPQCQQYVSEYGPLAFNFLLQYLDPTTICGDIGFCSAVKSFKPLAFTAIKTILKMPTVSSDLCSDCKALVNDADGLLKNATIQKMFLTDLSVVCKYFGGLQSECKDLIMEYGPLVFQYIATYINVQKHVSDPTTICDDIGLCPAVTLTLKADQCTDCKTFFQDVVTKLNDPSTQKIILNEIATLCGDLGPSLGPQCQQYVSEYGPLVINFLLQYLDPTAICGDIGFCPSVTRPPMNLVKENADQCTDCKNFFQDVSTVLNTPAVQQKIIQEVENLCNDLGPSLGPQCQQYVSEYGSLVINFILGYLDPNMICGDIGFCSALPKLQWNLFNVNGDVCTDCKSFLQDVANMLKNQSTQQLILQEIETLCNDLGPSLGPQCQQYVSQYGPLVFNLVLQYLDPVAICGDIGFCSALSAPILPIINGDMCADCKSFLQDVANMLKNQSTQQMILQEIETLCNDLGPSLGPQCQQYVSEYGPLVFNLVLQYLDPVAICGDIGFCSALSARTLPIINGDMCADCKSFLQDVANMLKNQATQQMILQEIETLCNDLGPSIGPQCQQYVSEYGPLVFNLVLQYLDPVAICGDIGFCSAVSAPIPPIINGDQCADCKNFFQDVSNMLKNNSVQQMILQELETLCNNLGPSLGPQCQQYVSEYGPLAFSFLLQYLDPTAICGDIGFCPAVFEPAKLFKLNADQCADCKNFFKDVSVMLNKPATQQMILQAIETLCNDLGPSVGPQCQQYVSAYGPLVINFLLQYLDPNAICGDIGFCSSTVRSYEKLVKVNADQCTDCTNFFQDVSTILNTPSVQQMIIQDIENVCNNLGPSIGPQCQQYVSEYGPLVINFVLQYLDPSSICSDIGFCNGVKEAVPFVELMVALPISAINEEPLEDVGPMCEVCKMVVTQVDIYLKQGSTQKQITAALAKACSLLPGPLAGQCSAFVDQYGPVILRLLANHMDPEEVCGFIKLCNAEFEQSTTCALCEYVMQQLDTLITKQSTEAEIEAALQKVCSLLPSSLSGECAQFVEQYTATIINLIVQEVPPMLICRTIGLCKKGPDSDVHETKGPTCVLCEYVLKELDTLLVKESTLSDIEAALDKVCGLLPGTMSQTCQMFVNTYTPTIVNLLVQSVPPRLICVAIGLCKFEDAPIPEIEQSTTCTLCEYVMQQLDTLITKQSTEEEIEAALNQVCSLLPSSLSGECAQFVQQYTATIINLIVQEVPPKLICQTIGLCGKGQDSVFADVDENLGPTCMLCQLVLKKLDALLVEESTLSDIEAALDEVCGLLPGKMSQQCQTFVDTYASSIIKLVVQTVPPRLICVAIRLCLIEEAPLPVYMNDLILYSVPKAEANEFCAICEFVMTELDKILVEPNTEAQIENALDMVCGFLPSTISETCQSFVSQYTKEIIFLLTQSVSPKQVCSAITLCTSVESDDEVPVEETPVHIEDDIKFEASTECVVCEYAMSELEKQLGKNATEQEIRFALDEVCSLLPDTLKEDCTILVNYYTTEVIYQFLRKYPANKVCTLLKVCAAVDGELKSVAHVDDLQQEPSCAICEFAVKELEQMLQKDSTEASIRKALDSLCSRLPSTVAKDCQTFVDYYTEEIIFILVSQLPPSTLCTTIKLCTASQSRIEKFDANTELCAVCEFVAKYLEEDIQKNLTEAEIKKALDMICSKLPSTITKECQMFVDYYTEEIIFILTSQFPPSKLCATLQLCDAVEEPQNEVDAIVSCQVCILAVRSAELFITKNTTEQEIDKVLEYLCQGFPGSLKEQCVTFVEQFGNAIPELIVTFGDPEKICQVMQLCPKQMDLKQLMFDNCSTGPEFWCASQTNADLCNAVDHCKRHVWN